MTNTWIRTWVEKDLKDIESHIIIIGELSSDCGVCKEIGLDISKDRQCPKCKAVFKYATSRLAAASNMDRYSVIRRIRIKCPDLIFVDYDDYKKLTSKSKAEEFLRNG